MNDEQRARRARLEAQLAALPGNLVALRTASAGAAVAMQDAGDTMRAVLARGGEEIPYNEWASGSPFLSSPAGAEG